MLGSFFFHAAAHSLQRTSACSRTVWVAFSCLSGGYPYLRRIRFTIKRIWARAFSRTVQSMVTLRLTASTSSCAIKHFLPVPLELPLELLRTCLELASLTPPKHPLLLPHEFGVWWMLVFGKSFPGLSNRRKYVFCSCFGLDSRDVKW